MKFLAHFATGAVFVVSAALQVAPSSAEFVQVHVTLNGEPHDGESFDAVLGDAKASFDKCLAETYVGLELLRSDVSHASVADRRKLASLGNINYNGGGSCDRCKLGSAPGDGNNIRKLVKGEGDASSEFDNEDLLKQSADELEAHAAKFCACLSADEALKERLHEIRDCQIDPITAIEAETVDVKINGDVDDGATFEDVLAEEAESFARCLEEPYVDETGRTLKVLKAEVLPASDPDRRELASRSIGYSAGVQYTTWDCGDCSNSNNPEDAGYGDIRRELAKGEGDASSEIDDIKQQGSEGHRVWSEKYCACLAADESVRRKLHEIHGCEIGSVHLLDAKSGAAAHGARAISVFLASVLAAGFLFF